MSKLLQNVAFGTSNSEKLEIHNWCHIDSSAIGVAGTE